MSIFELEETDAVLVVDIEPYLINGRFEGEMSTIRVLLNGEQVNWWPKLGPWTRAEEHARKIAERY